MPETGCRKIGPDDVKYNLVFFSIFEELGLPIKGPIEDAGVGVVKFYEPYSTPSLYVAPAEKMVGRIPLLPYNPLQIQKEQEIRFPNG
jgi:hypothetical protein